VSENRNEKNLRHKTGAMGFGWYIDFSMKLNGKKERFWSFGGRTKEEARNELSRIRLNKFDERRGLKRPGNGEPIPFEDFAREFLELYGLNISLQRWHIDQGQVIFKRS